MRQTISIILVLLLTSLIFLSIPTTPTMIQRKFNRQNISTNYLLVITPEKFRSECFKLMEHKNNFDIETILSTTNYIYNTFDGEDKQEKIKNCIRHAYDTYKISFVLLIGDFTDIPVRYCHNNDGYELLEEPFFISDLYYADLYDEQGCLSSWDTDTDGLYGEWNGDFAEDQNISLTPEVAIGRLPCSNHIEARAVINKIIRYENTKNWDTWFNTIVVAGGDTYSEARGYNDEKFDKYEGEHQTSKAIHVMKGFNATALWASTGTLSTLSLITSINKGCGFLYLSGHGNPGIWTTHPPNSAENVGVLPNFFIPVLSNRNRLPICIVGGCMNSQFDVHPTNILKEPFSYSTWHSECWSWKLTSLPYGGSIATIGCTGLSWQGIEFGGGGNDWLNLEFFKEYMNGTKTLGQIWKNVMIRYIETFPIQWNTPSGGTSAIDAKTIQEWVLLGDPTLKIGR